MIKFLTRIALFFGMKPRCIACRFYCQVWSYCYWLNKRLPVYYGFCIHHQFYVKQFDPACVCYERGSYNKQKGK